MAIPKPLALSAPSTFIELSLTATPESKSDVELREPLIPHTGDKDGFTETYGPLEINFDGRKESKRVEEFKEQRESKEFSVYIVSDTLLSLKIVPPNCQCLEYQLFKDKDVTKSGKKALLQRIQQDLANLKQILQQNRQVKKLIIRERVLSETYIKENGTDNNPSHYFFDSRISNIASSWYEGLLDSIRGTSVDTFEFRDMVPQYHPINYGNDDVRFYHYGPLNPIKFCQQLYDAGIRSLDLNKTHFPNYLPSVLLWIHLAQAKSCLETCSTKRVIDWLFCSCFYVPALCCGDNPHTRCCSCSYNSCVVEPSNDYADSDLNQLVKENDKYLQEMFNCLGQFTELRFSCHNLFSYMYDICFLKNEQEKNRPGERVNLQLVTKALSGKPLRRLVLEKFDIGGYGRSLWVWKKDFLSLFQTICQNNQLEELGLEFPHLVDLYFQNNQFDLSSCTIGKDIGYPIVKSRVQKLNLMQKFPNQGENSHVANIYSLIDATISICELLANEFKRSKLLIECRLLPNLENDLSYLTIERYLEFRLKRYNVLRRISNLLNNIQAFIANNLVESLVQAIRLGEEAETPTIIQTEVDRNQTLNDIFQNRTWCLEDFNKPLSKQKRKLDKDKQKQILCAELEPKVLEGLKRRFDEALSSASDNLPLLTPGVRQIVLSYLYSPPPAKKPQNGESAQLTLQKLKS